MKSRFDVVVVGAGPAGIAAAVRANELGARVAVLDDNPGLGGQIWRGGGKGQHGGQADRWLGRLRSSPVAVLSGATVISGHAGAKSLMIESADEASELDFGALVIATGAREVFLPFPGWTLPGVTGVGGLQALVKSGVPLEGKRIVVAGSGPLLLAAAVYFRKQGARVCAIVEQAAARSVAGFVLQLAAAPAKAFQAAALRASLAGVPYRTAAWVEAAEGDGRVERVRLRADRRTWTERCDYAAVSYGLHPNTELAALLGCEIGPHGVVVGETQQTSLAGVYCAGECTGIGGVDLSLVEGQIAGYAAGGDTHRYRSLLRERERARRFASRLNAAFMLRPELRRITTPETIVCRCEDVPFANLQAYSSFRAAKLHTRCGMGPCQGRICGTAGKFLLGWTATHVRPPVFPASVASLAFNPSEEEAIVQE
jgi:NADPH-dependent 2,4-dienoyl-CoA reductase/sulfur reductase-like enzyme